MKKSLSPNSNLPLLHAIRGVAAFYVVVFHAKFILWSGGREYMAQFPRSGWNIGDYFKFGVDMLSSAGSQMVMIFFVLSGFFIAMSLENIKGTMAEKMRTFYSVRFTRIYIPYISSIALSVFVLFWITKFSPDLYQLSSNREFNNRLIAANHDVTLSNFAKGLLFDKNNEYIGFNYAYWSLLYEGIFYLVIPFIYQFKKQYLLVSGLFYLAGMFVINSYHPGNAFIRFLFEYNFYFAVGQAIYIYRERLGEMVSSKNYKWAMLMVSMVLFLFFNVLALAHQDFWANFLSAIVASILMLLFLNYEIKNTLFIRGIKKLGQISYSLYLVHIPTLIVVYVLLHKYTGKIFFYNRIYIIGVIASVVTGYLFFKLVEEPSLKLIKRIKVLMKEKNVRNEAVMA